MNEYVLKYNNFNRNPTLLECIQLYRDANFSSIEGVFVTLSENGEYVTNTENIFSTMIDHINHSAYVASGNEQTLIYFTAETKGVMISEKEYTIFKNYTSSLQNTIEGITHGIIYWKKTNDLMVTIEQYQLSYEIIHDSSRLYEYITSKPENNFISGLATQLSLHKSPELKEHVEEYYLRYGWPKDFIFDEFLMAQIISESNPI